MGSPALVQFSSKGKDVFSLYFKNSGYLSDLGVFLIKELKKLNEKKGKLDLFTKNLNQTHSVSSIDDFYLKNKLSFDCLGFISNESMSKYNSILAKHPEISQKIFKIPTIFENILSKPEDVLHINRNYNSDMYSNVRYVYFVDLDTCETSLIYTLKDRNNKFVLSKDFRDQNILELRKQIKKDHQDIQ